MFEQVRDVEVVILGCPNEAALRTIHARYFVGLDELTEAVTRASA